METHWDKSGPAADGRPDAAGQGPQPGAAPGTRLPAISNPNVLVVGRNDRCAESFYDRSRNNSAVWHDSRACGNAIYLRASRARKRQGALTTKQHAKDAEKP